MHQETLNFSFASSSTGIMNRPDQPVSDTHAAAAWPWGRTCLGHTIIASRPIPSSFFVWKPGREGGCAGVNVAVSQGAGPDVVDNVQVRFVVVVLS